jgi:hypothetical protein
MRRSSKPVRSAPASPERRLAGYIAKFEPTMQARIRSVRRALRRRLPTANELVYDNYNFFVIGYSPTERPSDSVVSLVAASSGVGLSFYRGEALIAAAVAQARAPFAPRGRGKFVIRSVSAKQRPRRKKARPG